MSSYSNYVSGDAVSGDQYDFVVNAHRRWNGLKLGDKNGNNTHIQFDNSSKALAVEVGGNNSQINYKVANSSGTLGNVLNMMLDNTTSNGYAGTFTGRAQANTLVVSGNDTRVPEANKLQLAQSNGVGLFHINKGSGAGGFEFKTFNSDGSIDKTNMTLLQSGAVNLPAYARTADALDENTAIAGLDVSGNLVRNFAINNRVNLAESSLADARSRLATVETNTISGNGPLPIKLNEVTGRINSLNFFSSPISLFP